MGRIYDWYVSGGTMKIKIHGYGDSLSITYADDFMIYASVTHTDNIPGVDFTTFHNRK